MNSRKQSSGRARGASRACGMFFDRRGDFQGNRVHLSMGRRRDAVGTEPNRLLTTHASEVLPVQLASGTDQLESVVDQVGCVGLESEQLS